VLYNSFCKLGKYFYFADEKTKLLRDFHQSLLDSAKISGDLTLYPALSINQRSWKSP